MNDRQQIKRFDKPKRISTQRIKLVFNMIKSIKIVLVFVVMALQTFAVQAQKTFAVSDDIALIQLEDSIFQHLSWFQAQSFGRVPANGLIVIKGGEAIMIDTPWTNEMTQQLVEFTEKHFKVKLTAFVAGHSHDDCIGGLEYLQSIGVESIANVLTVEKCRQEKLPVPSKAFTDSLVIDMNGLQLECQFHGGGHTSDNITVWIPEKKLLFGGCLIKSADAENLGYTAEAVMQEWDTTVRKVKARYKNIKTVVPGHGDAGGVELLDHTVELVEKFR